MLKSIPPEELNLVEWFLDRFCFVANGSTAKSTIDLKMTLKSLPNRMDMSNIDRVDYINFHLMQRSIIACQNDD